MALQIRRAYRFLSSPQDLIALRASNRASREKVPGSFSVVHLLSLSAVLATAIMASGCAYVTHQPVKYYPYPSPPDSKSARDDDEKLAWEEKYKKEYRETKHKNSEEDKKHTGSVRYYLSSPYLLVYSDGKGNLFWRVYNLPDQTKLMVATPHQFFAKTSANFTFTNGVLTSSKSEADSTAAIKAVIGAIEKVLPLVGAAILDTTRTTKIQAPRLYKIVIIQDTLKLIGVPSHETISITLKPGS